MLDISRLLGHSNVRTALRRAHHGRGNSEQAVETIRQVIVAFMGGTEGVSRS